MISASAPETGGTLASTAPATAPVPWQGQADARACTFAFGHLLANLKDKLNIDDRIHAETLLTTAAAVAGFAAQRAMYHRVDETRDIDTLRQIRIVNHNGHKYHLGEPLNRTLLPDDIEDQRLKLWSYAAGAAVTAGLDPDKLPALATMFESVSSSIGTADEGFPPSAPAKHRASVPAKTLLKLAWPLAKMCFEGRFPKQEIDYGATDMSSRPMIAAAVVANLMREVSPVLAPDIALAIVMETAIYASKVDVSEIEVS